MSISFDNLFNRIAYQLGYHHKVCTQVDKHGNERVAQIVYADGLHPCFFAIAAEDAAQCIVCNRLFPAEKERGLPLVDLQFFLYDTADGSFLHLLRLCRSDGKGCSVEGLSGHGLVKDDACGLDVSWGERKHFSLSSACKKQQSEEGVVHRVIDNGDKLFKVFPRPNLHPNCRHEFIPVWLELMDEKELTEEIERSKISSKADTRSQKERDAYAEWQAEHRQRYNEQQYFDRAKQVLGSAMPYKDIAAFRRSYRARTGSFAHQKSHNLIRDCQIYTEYRQVLKDAPGFPKTLAKFQEIKYNKDTALYQKLKREKNTIFSIKQKGWSESFTRKAVSAYYEFKARNIEFTDHGVARFLSRDFSVDLVERINNKPFNYCQNDGKKIKFYEGTAVIYTAENDLVVSVIERKNIKEDWHEIKN